MYFPLVNHQPTDSGMANCTSNITGIVDKLVPDSQNIAMTASTIHEVEQSISADAKPHGKFTVKNAQEDRANGDNQTETPMMLVPIDSLVSAEHLEYDYDEHKKQDVRRYDRRNTEDQERRQRMPPQETALR